MKYKQVFLGLFLLSLLSSSIVGLAYSWWQAGEAAGAGAVTGAALGTVIPGLGTLIGAGVGAIAGFVSDSLMQLIYNAPSTTTNTTIWTAYAKDSLNSIYQQSEIITDNEINQVNLLQQSQTPFQLTAQKWEQVNYNGNVSTASPYEFYQMLNQTGFLSYAARLIGGSQALWIDEQNEINTVNEQLSSYSMSISYNTNPNASIDAITPSTVSGDGGQFFVIVIGSVNIGGGGATITTYAVTPNGLNKYNNSVLASGAYILQVSFEVCTNAYGTFHKGYGLSINPNQGMALLYTYSSTNNEYSYVSWNFNQPTSISLNNPSITDSIPSPASSLPVIAEQVGITMLGAAEIEYTTLKSLGYVNTTQIPSNLVLPTLNLNIGNFSNFTNNLQAYNLYLAQYTRELLQIEQTLQNLSQEGRLNGLQTLSFNTTSPLSLYGEYGGFVVQNGSIILPNGQKLTGLFLIQPYGGSLTLSSNGGIVGSGGAIAYILIPTSNGTYALGTMYILDPGSTIQGNVQNPGTLSSLQTPANATYFANATYTNPFHVSASSLLTEAEDYLISHPLDLVITGTVVIVLILVIIKSLVS